ncbi:MAG: hypothetical protein KGN84_20250 [Acidobacteriota bacterium]|nr:hypothetical protein [Acidobacteriota bacterium]
MHEPAAELSRLKPRHWLGGLEAGVLGGIYMILWLMLGSSMLGRSVWNIPNLFATTFYGSRVYREEYLPASWSGIAVILAICGLVGILWGLVWREDRPAFLPLFGALVGLAVYFLIFDVVLQRVNPLVSVYAPLRLIQIGCVIWGMTLAKSPVFSRRIGEALGADYPAVEIGSGEVIR